jgi:hypothetical protein
MHGSRNLIMPCLSREERALSIACMRHMHPIQGSSIHAGMHCNWACNMDLACLSSFSSTPTSSLGTARPKATGRVSSFPLSKALVLLQLKEGAKRGVAVSTGGANGLPCLRWPLGRGEVAETAALSPVGGVGPSRSRFWCPVAAVSHRNKVLSHFSPSRRRDAPAPATSA